MRHQSWGVISGLAAFAVVAMARADGGLEEMAAKAREQADVPALGLMVIRGEEAPMIAVDGLRVAGGEARATVDDQWHWGSIGKSMTATLVARLAEQGVIAWDDTVESRLGASAPNMNEAYREVTFRHLLSHNSGLQPNIPVPRFGEFGQHPEDPIADRLKWVRIALQEAPVGPKGETYQYSNNGYIVAGAMLEATTGLSWEALMRREVFEPLGISRAGFGSPGGAEPVDHLRGHHPQEGVDTPVSPDSDNPAALGPAGRIHMPLADMARYLHAHVNRDAAFLSAESYDLLHTTPFEGFYAMGWVVTGPNGRFHNGSNNQWYAEVAFDLERRTAAAVAVNDGDIAGVQAAVRETLGRLLKPEQE